MLLYVKITRSSPPQCVSTTEERSSHEYVSLVGYMHAPRSIQMNSCVLFFILCFYFTHSIILINFYESPFFLYFPLFYFPLFTHLFAMRHFTFTSASRLPTFRSEPTPRRVFASTRCNSFASVIPMCLHLLQDYQILSHTLWVELK